MAQPDSPKEPKAPVESGENKKISFNELKSGERIDELYNMAKSNTTDTIAIIVLFVGIILSVYSAFYGGLLIGLVSGYYFADIAELVPINVPMELNAFSVMVSEVSEPSVIVRST